VQYIWYSQNLSRRSTKFIVTILILYSSLRNDVFILRIGVLLSHKQVYDKRLHFTVKFCYATPVYKSKGQSLRVANNDWRILRFERTALHCLLQWDVQHSKILFELLDPEDRGNKVFRNDSKCKQTSRCPTLEDLSLIALILHFERQTNILKGCNKRLLYEGHNFTVLSP